MSIEKEIATIECTYVQIYPSLALSIGKSTLKAENSKSPENSSSQQVSE